MVDYATKAAVKAPMLTEHEIVEHLWTRSGTVSDEYLESLVASEPSRFRRETVDNLKYLVREMHASGASTSEIARRIILEVRDDVAPEDDSAS